MNYDVSKSTLAIRDQVFEGCKEVPVDLDFSLPEYCPDIKKILKCRMCPNITSRNISGDRLNIEGMTKIRVMYVDSENNRMRCCENSVPFSCSVDIRCTPENAFAITSSRVEYVNCRAVSPRKLDIHGAFSICSEVYSKKNLELSSSVSGKDIQQKISDIKMNNLIGIGQQQFALSEMLEVPEGHASPEIIINSEVSVVINEYKNMSNKTVVKGEAVIKLLYMDDLASGHTDVLDYNIPISQIVDVPGITEDSNCAINAEILTHDEQIRTENGQNSNFVACEIKLAATVMAYSDKEVSVVSDVYSTDYDVEIMSEPVKMNQLTDFMRESFNHKESINLSDGSISKILDVWSDSCSVSPHFEDGALTFKCKMNVCVLALDGDNIPIYVERIFEFSHSKECENASEDSICEARIVPTSIGYGVSGSNGIEIRLKLEIFGELYLGRKYSMVTSVVTDESSTVDKDDASLTVYYACEGEDVWDIARKYYTSASMIKQENELLEDKIQNSGMLLIPMK